MYDIKSAVGNRSFTLYYQPKIDLKEKKVKLVEALNRLKIDDKIIPPIRFILDAEKNGDIKEIDKWVFKRLPEDLRYVKIKTQENPTISFNVSASHFTDQDIVESIKNIIE